MQVTSSLQTVGTLSLAGAIGAVLAISSNALIVVVLLAGVLIAR